MQVALHLRCIARKIGTGGPLRWHIYGILRAFDLLPQRREAVAITDPLNTESLRRFE